MNRCSKCSGQLQASSLTPQVPLALACSGGMKVFDCSACCNVSSEAPVWPHSPARSGCSASATISAECTTRGLHSKKERRGRISKVPSTCHYSS